MGNIIHFSDWGISALRVIAQKMHVIVESKCTSKWNCSTVLNIILTWIHQTHRKTADNKKISKKANI